MTTSAPTPGVVRSLIPARIDRLPWSSFHTRMVVALGVAWILDGLEITVASSVTDVLTHPETLALSSTAAGLVASVYLAGEVVGALFFGRLSDKLGRRNLFMITLGVYLIGSGLTALTLGNTPGWIVFLYITRFIAGMGIGGEYAAINSAIDELIPARFRGRVDIAVNGTYWGGAILGTLGTFVFLKVIDLSLGWRLAFLIGPVLGLIILAHLVLGFLFFTASGPAPLPKRGYSGVSGSAGGTWLAAPKPDAPARKAEPGLIQPP